MGCGVSKLAVADECAADHGGAGAAPAPSSGSVLQAVAPCAADITEVTMMMFHHHPSLSSFSSPGTTLPSPQQQQASSPSSHGTTTCQRVASSLLKPHAGARRVSSGVLSSISSHSSNCSAHQRVRLFGLGAPVAAAAVRPRGGSGSGLPTTTVVHSFASVLLPASAAAAALEDESDTSDQESAQASSAQTNNSTSTRGAFQHAADENARYYERLLESKAFKVEQPIGQ